jgi:hypothetical protein
MMRRAAAIMLLALVAQAACATQAGDITLALPHTLHAGEMAWIEVQVGVITRGQEINVTTTSGRDLGTISPHLVRSAQDAGTYSLPVPGAAIRDGHIDIRLAITQAGASPRAPTSAEVHGVKLTVGGSDR